MAEGTKNEIATPFHPGELKLQERLGVRERVASYAPRVIRDHMPSEHREFFAQLPQLIVGSVDQDGRPWASMMVGRPGFISTPDSGTMTVSTSALYGDPLADNLRLDTPLGFLGIEFHTRRRNRLNGKVTALGKGEFQIAVDQSFGNCPQYIQARGFQMSDGLAQPDVPRPLTRAKNLDQNVRAALEKADTFFIASVYTADAHDRRHGVDVSHRGGKPGFVRVLDDTTFIFPDFSGNFHFNTLGNITLNPKVGLLFPDFETGHMIYLTGTAEIIWDGAELAAFTGAERLLRITLDEIIMVENSSPLRWDFRGYAPDLDRTGGWQDVAEVMEANQDRDRWRSFVVARIEKESETILSFYLTPEDGKALASYRPGQYLPIRLNIAGQGGSVLRTYTISETPNGDYYRLSVKREDRGLVSRYLHDMTPGSRLEAMAPRGKFTLDGASDRPVVLLSGGVGITPMIAMMNNLLLENVKRDRTRPVYFIHGTENGQQHAFGPHVRKLAAQIESLTVHIRYGRPLKDDRDYDSVGHIDMALLQSILPLDDYDFYLCGPPPFMEALYGALSRLGVGQGRIHYESFGPAMLLKSSEKKTEEKPVAEQAPVKVSFAKSGIEAQWRPEKGTLLELAEAEGLTPVFSCRSGVCGSCATKIKCGSVDYLDEPIGPRAADEALLCCSVPTAGQHEESCGKEFGLILDI